MNKFSKFVLFFFIAIASVLLLYILVYIYHPGEYLLPIILSSFILLSVWAIFDMESLILFLIFSFPLIIKYNDKKINLSSYLSFLQGTNILINPVSIIYLFMIVIGFLVLIEKRSEFKKLPLRYILTGSTIYVVLSILWSDFKMTSVIETIYFIVPFVFYFFCFVFFSTPEKFNKLLYAIIFSSLIPVVSGIIQIINQDFFYEPDSSLGRLIGSFTQPNSFGLYLFLIITVSISLYLARPNRTLRKNLITFIFIALLAILFVLTYSRVSWMCLFIFFILLSFANRYIIYLIASSVPIVFLLYVFFDNFRDRISDLWSTGIFTSWQARKSIWTVGWSQILEKPIWGYGVGTAEKVIEQAKYGASGTNLPHNDLLLYALELGVVGVLIWVNITIGAIYYIYQTWKNFVDEFIVVGKNIQPLNFRILSYGLLAMFIALLFANIFESTSQKMILQIIIWSLFGGLFGFKKNQAA